MHVGSGSTPVPDPTLLTTQALVREIAALREVLEAKIDGERNVLATKIDGMAKAVELLQVISDRQPQDVDKKVTNLRILHEEKFHSIDVQFHERDVRVEQTAKDTKTAVDAALAAQEKSAGKQADSFALSIGKSENATTKQIDALDEKINDMKDRLMRIEGVKTGRGDVWGFVVGAVGLVAAVIGIVFALTRGG